MEDTNNVSEQTKNQSLTDKKYITFLKEQERAVSTIRKYEHDLLLFCAYLKETPLTKERLIDWKQELLSQLAPAVAAATLAAYILPKLRSGEWKRVLECEGIGSGT